MLSYEDWLDGTPASDTQWVLYSYYMADFKRSELDQKKGY